MEKKYCSYCGNEIKKNVHFCSYCGKEIDPIAKNQEKSSTWWGVLGFFYPIVGLILYLVLLKEKPGISKKAGIGALTSVICYVLLMTIIMIIALTSLFNNDGFSNQNEWDDFPNQSQEVYGEDDWS